MDAGNVAGSTHLPKVFAGEHALPDAHDRRALDHVHRSREESRVLNPDLRAAAGPSAWRADGNHDAIGDRAHAGEADEISSAVER
nr:hypothetical protein [Microbacterium sp. Leaf161]